MEAILVQIIQWFSLERSYVRRFTISSVIYSVSSLVWLVVIHFTCHCTKDIPIEWPHNLHQDLLTLLRDHLQRLWHATETWTELVRQLSCTVTLWPPLVIGLMIMTVISCILLNYFQIMSWLYWYQSKLVHSTMEYYWEKSLAWNLFIGLIVASPKIFKILFLCESYFKNIC